MPKYIRFYFDLGKDGAPMGVMARGNEPEMTEERIAHILNEASHMMKPQQQDDTHSNEDSKSPNHPQVLL